MALTAALLLAAALAAVPAEASKVVENVVTRRDPAQTYTLVLPETAAGEKRPLLVVLDPRGRGTVAAEIFRPAAEELGWIVVSSNQSRSDESVDPNLAVMQALLPDALERYPVDRNRVYLTGFSGTAIFACAFALRNDGVAGVISVGGRHVPQVPPEEFRFAHYGFTGDVDFNNRDMRELEALLAKSAKTAHRLDVFPGSHEWIDAARAREALVWMEVVAMKQGRRDRDAAFVTAAMIADLAAARALESGARPLEALRRYEAIGRTYDGLADVAAVQAEATRLAASREVARAKKEESRWDEFEKSYMRETLFPSVARILAPGVEKLTLTPARLSRELQVADLQRRAKREGGEGRAAQRLLASLFAQTNFYLVRQLFESKQYQTAIAVLGVAIEIHPEIWLAHYNTAAAEARLGHRARALESLQRAIAAGFRSAAQLRADEDFGSMRGDPAFEALLASLGP